MVLWTSLCCGDTYQRDIKQTNQRFDIYINVDIRFSNPHPWDPMSFHGKGPGRHKYLDMDII